MTPLQDLISFITKDQIVKIFYSPTQRYTLCKVCQSNIIFLVAEYTYIRKTHMHESYYYVGGFCYICYTCYDDVFDKRAIQNVYYESIPTITI